TFLCHKSSRRSGIPDLLITAFHEYDSTLPGLNSKLRITPGSSKNLSKYKNLAPILLSKFLTHSYSLVTTGKPSAQYSMTFVLSCSLTTYTSGVTCRPHLAFAAILYPSCWPNFGYGLIFFFFARYSISSWAQPTTAREYPNSAI